tara:strand:+ start:18018 stop:18386 length:369 start_codon:yes stop_codon:yes gene_type:complete
MKYNEITNREEYLWFRKQWAVRYKYISRMIRMCKENRKQFIWEYRTPEEIRVNWKEKKWQYTQKKKIKIKENIFYNDNMPIGGFKAPNEAALIYYRAIAARLLVELEYAKLRSFMIKNNLNQ